jgi:hypothetical protein
MSIHLPPPSARRLSWLALAPALVLLPARAHAGPSEEPGVEPFVEIEPRIGVDPRPGHDPRLDPPDPPRATRTSSPLSVPVTVSIGASYQQLAVGAPVYGGILLVGLPLERFAAPALHAHAIGDEASPSTPAPSPSPGQPKLDLRPPPPPPKLPVVQPGVPPPPLRVPVVVTPDAARGAVDAALRRAHLADPGARFDALAARARYSAGLPELRLRVLRTVDVGQGLSPTEYDPARLTAIDDVTFWLEARATWRLDRLLFAEEEVTLERMRHERADAQARLTAQVLKLLFEWQRALALGDNPALAPEENLSARLKAIEAEAELDLLTDRWFSKWLAGRSPP